MKIKKKLGRIASEVTRIAAGTRIGHHLVMNEALRILSDARKFSGKNWQTTDQFFTVARRHLVSNEYWIPGPIRTRNLALEYFKRLKELPLDLSKPFLDLGCGPRTPYGLGMIFFLNGWNECWALDIEPCDNRRASEALSDLLKDVLIAPEDYCFHSTSNDIVDRARHFDIKALEAGDLIKGLNGSKFRHVVSDVVDFQHMADIPRFGTICSHTVMEHLMDLPGALQSMRAISVEGAMHCHYIDFVDHRAYTSPDHFDWWSFLESPKSEKDEISNKLRCSEMKRFLEDATFQVLGWNSENADAPHNIRTRLHPSWNSISNEDLQALRAWVIMKA